MPLLNLADLQQLTQIGQSFSSHQNELNPHYLEPNIQHNFQQIIKQLFLGLPVEPLLNTYPQIANWIAQMRELTPELFQPRKKLLIDTPVIAPLKLKKQQIFIQIHTNIGIKHGIPRLYEWAVRKANLNWQDRVKLWATTIYYSVSPEQLQMIIVALDDSQPAERAKIYWDKQQQKQTQRWLVKLLSGDSEKQPQSLVFNQDQLLPVELDAIAEIIPHKSNDSCPGDILPCPNLW
jgi:hypothetical protein